jgi:hypothetical protein
VLLFGIPLPLTELVSKFPDCVQGKDLDTHNEEEVEDESELVLKLDGKNIDGKSLQSIFERRCQLAVCDSFRPSIPLKVEIKNVTEAGCKNMLELLFYLHQDAHCGIYDTF